jgi:glycerol-3-phosphate acyltransferase PlsY
MFIIFIFFLVIAYLLGSVSSGIIVCKLMGLPDPRTQGSGNIGATNVLRIGGPQAAAIVLVGDVLKGYLPVLLAHFFGLANISLVLVGLAAVLGHIYPLFSNFEGGKGIATAFGVWFALSFVFGSFMFIIWAAVVGVSRYSSLASVCAAAAAPFLGIWLTGNYNYFIPLGLISLLLVWRHMDNISRLREGSEPKVNFNFKK